jgi:two-component system chemotaxis response regulator CheY
MGAASRKDREAAPISAGRMKGDAMHKALVVDDSRTIRKILAATMEEIGFEVLEAENGREALEVLEAQQTAVPLILVDWDMPEMNGLDLLKRLRQNPEFSSMVVVMVTAQADMEHIVEALNAGANEYVMKPFTKDILLGKIELTGIQL